MPRVLLALGVLLLSPRADAQAPIVSTPESREAVSLTVYNGGFGVVREVRALDLPRGLSDVRFEGVPSRIDPTSIAVRSLTAPGALSVREQNYQYNLIGTTSVLDAAVGQRVRITRDLGDRTVTESGTLISQPGQGRIVRLDDGRVLVDPAGTIELLALPAGLLSRPSLLWRLGSERAGAQRVEASYLTEGINWTADYVAVIDEAETGLDLTGWVTLNNQSGAGYQDAQLQLIAGDVRRIRTQLARGRAEFDGMPVPVMAEAAAPEQEAFFEYHLYTFPTPTTLAERETKQLELLSAAGASVSRRLVIDATGGYFPFYRPRRPGASGQEVSAAVVMTLDNTERNQMGMPLPAGKVRVYKQDRRGNLQFLGEDQIGHTPTGETLRLYVGDAFDVVGTRREVSNRRIDDRTREVTVEVEVRNRKETAAAVDVVERAFWGDWRLREQSHPGEKLDARTYLFPLTLPAGETVTVRYTARLRS